MSKGIDCGPSSPSLALPEMKIAEWVRSGYPSFGLLDGRWARLFTTRSKQFSPPT